MAPIFTGVSRGFGGFAFGISAVSGVPGVSATGGTVYTPGDGYKYHVFSAGPSSFNVTSGGEVSILVVAGGGGGGGGSQPGGAVGSGAGAGGVIYMETLSVSAANIPLYVGPGGEGSAYNSGYGPVGANGENTVFGNSPNPYYLLAIGGGGGTSYDDSTGINGGSGGAAAYPDGGSPGSTGGTGTQPSQPGNSGTYGYGNPGGAAAAAPAYTGGGGGGAGGVGQTPVNTNGGNGGPGQPFPIFPGPLFASQPADWQTAVGPTGLFGGGGGGGEYNGTIGSGGPGGGGQGNPWPGSGSTPALSFGVDGTGGGGGGGVGGGDGGDGIIIIRYPLTISPSPSPSPGSIVYSISCYSNFTTQRTIAGLNYQRSSDLVPYQDIYGNALAEAGIMYVTVGNPVQLQKTSSTIENWISSGTSMTNVGSTHAITGSPIAGVYVTGITGGDRYYFCTNSGYLYSLKIDGTDLVNHSDGVTIDVSGNWQGVCFDPVNEKLYVACYTPASTIYEFTLNMSTGATSYVTKYVDSVNTAMNIRGIVYDWRNQYFYVKETNSNVFAYTSMSAFTSGTRTTFITSGLADASDTTMYRGYFYDTQYAGSYNVMQSTKLLGTDRCL